MKQIDLKALFEHRMQEKKLTAQEANSQLKQAAYELYSELNNTKNSFKEENDGDHLLICEAPLDDFFTQEDHFQDAVTNFTRILFAESSPDFRPENESCGHLLRGMAADSEQHVALREECSRLELAFRRTLEVEVAAEVARARADAKCRELRRLAADPRAVPAKMSDEEHRTNLSRCHSLRAHVDRLRKSELPGLLHDRSCALAAEMELAQLKLQAMRHRFFIYRQEKLIRLLLKQQSWDALVVMLHETERRSHKMLLRILQRLQDHRLQLLDKTREIEFDSPADVESVNLNHSSVHEALKLLGANRIFCPPEVTPKEADLFLQQNEKYLEQLQELQKHVDALSGRFMPEGPGGDPQLSFPEIRQLLMNSKAQVKSVSQKVKQFTKMAASHNED